ncbi:MAG: agmatine deiminase family protein [Nanoarchaeota archaeon]
MAEKPKNLGYRMPAEWETHEATWLTWPKDPDTFPKGIIESVEEAYIKIISALAKGEKVNILVDNKETEGKILSMLPSKENVFFHYIKSADVWVRDYGPIFVKKNNEVAATKWVFNSWGNKYGELLMDNETGMQIAEFTKKKIFEPGMVLEGGSIETNGLGTCITTKQCLLNKNRNPKLSKEDIEEYLKGYLGFENFIWLKDGIEGDDTDGHVDDIARFVNRNTVVCMAEKNQNDENYKNLKENFRILKKSHDQDGKKINVIPIQMPRKIEIPERRLAASYANFYIGNAAVLVPAFNDKNGKKATSTIGKFFPGKEVIGIDCKDLVYGYGGIHCITQQQPV